MAEQQITTAEELDALPVAFRYAADRHGDLWHRGDDDRWRQGDSAPYSSAEVVRAWGPVTPLAPMRTAPAPVDQGDREALAVEIREALGAADGDEVVLDEYALADITLAWFAAQPKTVTAEEREQAVLYARGAVGRRIEWPSLHWGVESVHHDAWPHIAEAAVDAALAALGIEVTP